MQELVFGVTRWRTICAFGTNPLVRVSDRIEALGMVSAIAISLLAPPAAGAVGTAVYDARNRTYTEQSQTGRALSATVTATRPAAIGIRPYVYTTMIEIRWRSEGGQRSDSLTTNRRVSLGDRIDIWVDDRGNRIGPASSRSAVADAVCVAVLLCMIVMGTTAALFAVVRWRLDVHRGADWDRDIADLFNRRSAD